MKTEVGTLDNRGTTPNWIRETFRADIPELRPYLLQMSSGLLELPMMAKEAVEKGKIPGAIIIEGQPYQVVPVSQRHDAIKTHIQTGVGYRSDHTSDDESIRAQVVVMPLWDDDPRLKRNQEQGALTDGKTGKGNGDGPADDSAAGRGAGGNGGPDTGSNI